MESDRVADGLRRERRALLEGAVEEGETPSTLLYGLLESCIDAVAGGGEPNGQKRRREVPIIAGIQGDPAAARRTALSVLSLRRAVRKGIASSGVSSEALVGALERAEEMFDRALETLLRPDERTEDASLPSAENMSAERAKRYAALITRKARGWIDVAGTRMCLMDIPGGWLNVGLSIMMFAGENTLRRAMFEAGTAETFSGTAVRSGQLVPGAEAFREAVETYSEAGFGDFRIEELRMEEGFARITCRDSFEGWAVLGSRQPSRVSVCFYSTGVLLSFMKNLARMKDLVAVETRCIGRGDEACEFVIGREEALRRVDVTPHTWGMTIKDKARHLEKLLEERKRMEKKLMEQERLASIGRLSTNVAHEIRNPLSAIKMNIQILSRNLRLEGYDRRRLEIALGEIRRLDRILADLLDIARPVKMRRAPVRVQDVLDRCLGLMDEKLRDRKVRVELEFEGTEEPVPMDGEKIEQAVLNVILNALEAMPGGGVLSIHAGKAMSLGREVIRLEISDTGQGIAADHMPRIFDPFFSTKAEGAGLGLCNVKKIIEAHEGAVEVEGRAGGRGTCFRIHLPAA